ncbi:MAG: restriction endonuclease subunit S [Parachlamydiaceae bacterium]|nr:restriction endonuclease subunit S [Parachlamydiaceae bacterium]
MITEDKKTENAKIQIKNVKTAVGCRLSGLSVNSEECFFGDLFISRPPKKTLSPKDFVTFLGMNDISEHGDILRQHSIRASEVKAGLTAFERSDILIAKITPCFENGKGACLDKLKTMVGFGSTEFHVLRAKPQVVPRYVYYHTRLLTFRMELERKMIGSAGQKRVPMKAIENYRIQVKHSYLEQQAIADVLSDIDSLVNNLDQLIAKKRNIKLAAMQQLLTGKQRLPGFSGEWKLKRFGDVLKVRHGKSQKEVEVINGKYPILASGGEIGRTNDYLYDKPSVLIGRKGTIDSPQYTDNPFWTIDTLFFTEISNSAFPKFIFYKFNMINWRIYCEASGVPSLNASTIEGIEFNTPSSLEEQIAIAQVLTDMEIEILALEGQCNKVRNLKQGMMQELLTGRIRLT